MINFSLNRTLADYIDNRYQPYKLFDGDDELCDPKYLTWVWTTEPKKEESNQMYYIPSIKKVIFNCPATVILWADGSKTVVKAITDLLERAEVAEARCKAFEKMAREYRDEIVPRYMEMAEKAERERDDAVNLLKRVDDKTGNCYGCKYFDIEREVCTEKAKKSVCDCGKNNLWEWRGIKEE